MWWLALKTKTSVSLSDESTSIASSTRQPLLHSILSVAFSVIYSERNLARSPLLSDIARKFFQFFVRGILPPSMTRLWAELFLYFAYLCQIWLGLLCICQKTHGFANTLSGAFWRAFFVRPFLYFIPEIKRCWSIVNVDGTMKIQFCSL